MATFNDFISPKSSTLNPFDLIGGCCYGSDSSLLFIKRKLDPEAILPDILSVDRETKSLFSLSETKAENDVTKYIFLSKKDTTRVYLSNKNIII
jgi:hypothetical protein